ncbi:MAG: cytochrome c oxidase subunit II [Deltaproteobacteria bacterium]|nr:cytochrome c oxidase subunit II [Deltaproteobacteria bacterium]
MKTFARYAALIGATAIVALIAAFAILGSPTATAQNPPPPAAGSAPPAAPAPAPAAGSAAAANPAEPTTCYDGSPLPLGPAGAKLQWFERLRLCEVEDNKGGNFWMPKAVNLEADSTDQMYYAVLALSAFFFFAIAAAIVYLVVRFRHRPGHKAEPSPTHHDALEITWTIIPTIICVFLFYYGWRTYIKVVTPPTKAVEVNVIASQWHWSFIHQGGAREENHLHVPVDTDVRLVMTSRDVLHAFYAPVMRVKQDIIPRRYTYAWFRATKPGTYRLTCAEYCGTDHSIMSLNKDTGDRAVVVVHKRGDYEKYLAAIQDVGGDITAEMGAKIAQKKGCRACHTIDGSGSTGPTWAKSWGTQVPTDEAGPVTVDENYIRESILTPTKLTHSGFAKGQMPSFEGQLKETEIAALIEFIKSLK